MLQLFRAFAARLPLPATRPVAPAPARSLLPVAFSCCNKYLVGLLVALAGLPAAAQRTPPTMPPPILYPHLSKTLDSLAYVDQWPQQQMFKQLPDSAGRNLEKVELANFARHQPILEKIVRQYGFPGFRQVGKKSSFNFWLLVQHADAFPGFQRRVLRLMRSAVKRKNADPANYAYLIDRVAIHTGLPEEYGTQVVYKGSPSLGRAVPKSLRDPTHVNQRRAAVGLEPLENYLDSMTKMAMEMNTPKTPAK